MCEVKSMPHTFLTIKTFYGLWLCVLLVTDAALLGLSPIQVAIALIGALSGGFMLNYFSSGELPLSTRVLKTIMSAIGGVFIGAAIRRYLNAESDEYIGAIFFITSFLILIFLRALLKVSETNATGIVTNIVSKVTQTGADTTEKETQIVTTSVTPAKIDEVQQEAVKHEIG